MQSPQTLNRWLQQDEGGQLWTPAVDVCETPTEIVLHAELPGMKKNEISVEWKGDTLTLGGERSMQAASEGEHFHRIERQYGAWQRTFRIEAPVEAEQIKAAYESGVLTVHLPKLVRAQPRRIEIEIR